MTLVFLVLFRFHINDFPFDSLHLIHCNHKIRKESEEEARFLKHFFSWLPFFSFERDSWLWNDENSLRWWRYQCFHKVITDHHLWFFLTGHHLEDRIETSFLNLMRGAWMRWFLNMQITQAHSLLPWVILFRPLLHEIKDSFYHFCKILWITYFEDYTNSDSDVSKRNWIRNNILTPLCHLWWSDTKFLHSMDQIYREIETFQPEDIEIVPIKTLSIWDLKNAGKILFPSPIVSKTILLDLRKKLHLYYNITQGKIDERLKRLNHKKGRKNLKTTTFFFVDQELYFFEHPTHFREETSTEEVVVDHLWEYQFLGETLGIHDKNLLWSTIRLSKPWDSFHGKTRNRWCLNQKIPLFRRNWIPLAVKDWNIIYIFEEIFKF